MRTDKEQDKGWLWHRRERADKYLRKLFASRD